MKCILLCAGYATRLFPLTKNFPKALLEIEEGKPLLNYIVEKVEEIKEVDEIYLITNDRYYTHFTNWLNENSFSKHIEVLNDNTTSNDDRLGAIGDISYVINKKGIDDDIIVIAGDSLFDYSLNDFVSFYKQKQAPVVCSKELDDIDALRRFAVAKLDENDKIISLVEKPANPESNIGVYATYLYPKSVLKEIKTYLEEGNNPDAPGYLVEYLYKIMPFYAYRFDGEFFDVGTHESLAQVRELYSKKEF